MPDALIYGTASGVVAYLLGSLPFAVWVGKMFFHTDIREHGSGNAGATNAWRILGWKAGLPVLLLDIFKGALAVWLPLWIHWQGRDPVTTAWLQVTCGILAATGHIFPVFAKFRGGKAVATLFGVWLGLLPLAACGGLAVFLLVWLSSRFVSLGSILAAVSLPVWVYLLEAESNSRLLFAILITILVLWTHRRNIRRLIAGEESRSNFSRRSGKG